MLDGLNGASVLGGAARLQSVPGCHQELSRCIAESNQREKALVEIITHSEWHGLRIVAGKARKGSPGGRIAYRGWADQTVTGCLVSADACSVADSAAARPCFTALV